MIVDWGRSLRIKAKEPLKVCPTDNLWVDVMSPKKIPSLQGNNKALSSIREWFVSRQCDEESGFLFIHGPSGVGKSSVVRIISEEYGFTLIHTFADIPRTPQKLDGILSEVSMVEGGILVLDDFEAFLKETSSLKYLSKLFRSRKKRLMVIMICNEVDSSFIPMKRVSTCVEFDRLSVSNISNLINRLSVCTRRCCYIPPMDIYFIASNSSGNACQVINQIQFMYSWTESPPPFNKRRRLLKNSPRLQNIDSETKNDSSTRMFFTVYKSSSVDGFLQDEQLLESMDNMNRYFLDMLGENLHIEYPKYFHNGTLDSMKTISECMDNISLADSNRPGIHEDDLYESENSQKWVEDDMNFVVCIHESLSLLKTRSLSLDSKNFTNPYKKKRVVRFKYDSSP